MTVQTPRIDRLDKNYIINGGFDYAQRSAGGTALIDSILSYDGPDRFVTRYFGGAPSTDYAWERNTDAPSYRTRYSGRFYNINVPDIATGLTLQQRVLSSNSVELTGEVCSLGFKYKAESFRKVTVKLSVPNAVDDHSAVTSFHEQTYALTTGLGSWLWFKLENITFPLTCSNGVQVDLFFHDSSITGSNTEIRIGEIKLNIGTFAQEFSYFGRNVEKEIEHCQRFFVNMGDVKLTGATAPNLEIRHSSMSFPVEMRIIPVFSFRDETATLNVFSLRSTNLNVSHGHSFGGFVSNTKNFSYGNNGNTTGGSVSTFSFNNLTASAEL